MKMRTPALIMLLLLSNSSVLFGQSEFVIIPAASYEIVDGITAIKVTVSVSEFLIAKTEVTQEDFSEIMRFNPSYDKDDKKPVENVSWYQAIRYCNSKSIRDRLQPCYNLSTGRCDFSKNGYRLPTDTEWTLASGYDPALDAETLAKQANIGSGNTKSIPRLLKSLREKGTKKAGSYPANKFGLYDMRGNVWEWCYDYYSPLKNNPIPLKNPHGPSYGLQRVIRGGCFISSVSRWRKSERSSLNPDYKSRFTGFRICRTAADRESEEKKVDNADWFEPYNDLPEGYKDNIGYLSSLVINPDGKTIKNAAQWAKQRERIRSKWSKLLGAPLVSPPESNVKLVKTYHEENYTGKLMYLQTEPDYWEKIFLMMPNKPLKKPTPVVIVPYYDVDVPAGKNMTGFNYQPPGVRSFAYLMAQQGYIAVAVKWFGKSYGEGPAEVVSNLKLKHPECTGLGKWVWDAQRLVDFLYSLPEVDHQNIGIIGHSLGAKMALYAAAMDERIKTVVFSEGGIGFAFSNYDDYWYFGDFINDIDKSTDQHELLALLAPRPFLLIGGDEYDTDKSWYYINAAAKVYHLFGKPQNIGYFNHRTGHSPSPDAVRLSIDWLKHFLR
ncbi:MAG: SUMF1/EgtB/PvdO family nonheme iron enzyme [Planctomycetota bacterium]